MCPPLLLGDPRRESIDCALHPIIDSPGPSPQGGYLTMTRWSRWVHAGAAWLFALGVLVQGYLAGQALPELGGGGDFEAHRSVGFTVMGILALVVLVSALVGRLPRVQVGL